MGIRDRMRLVFHAESSGGAPDEEAAIPSVPKVELVAYTEDRRLFGQIALAEGRLTDLLNGTEELELVDIAVETLASGEVVETGSLILRRDEILAVHAAGPRGNRGLRASTRSHPIVVQTGPYRITGDLHAPPTSDPFVAMRRRPPMVPLTNGVIEYTLAGEPVTRNVDTLIVNHAAMDWAVPAHDEEVRVLAMPLHHDAHAKDYTGEVHVDADAPAPAESAPDAAGPPEAEAPPASGAAVAAAAVGGAATSADTGAPTLHPVAGWAMPSLPARDVQRGPSILGPARSAAEPATRATPMSPAVLPGEGPVAALRRRMQDAREPTEPR